ncbi:MAG: hypothetical protein NZ898_00065 [Myxococcota bacterium]|nr:hypothetical protein [Myxococcota bacterium]MDW8361678.1 hypothetical protein [Myxococcales bacterium]
MSRPQDALVVEPDGTVRVAGRSLERRLRDLHGIWEPVILSSRLLVLRRSQGAEGVEAARVGGRIRMAGEIVGRTSVLETLDVAVNHAWRGDLHIVGGGAHRVLSLDRGALKSASSTAVEERLGEVMYAAGAIERAQLDALLRELGPERRLGQLAVERGLLAPEQLFEHLQRQAEQIVHGALLVHEGIVLFVEPDDSDPPPTHTMHLSLQALLMEGVQRIDEMALFRERIPSSDVRPRAIGEAGPGADLDQAARTVLAACDGERSISELGRLTGLGEFATTRAVYQLLTAGLVRLAPARRVDEDAARRLVAQFNDVLRDVFLAVATYGGLDRTRATVGAWIAGSGYEPLLGSAVEEDGSVSVERVLEGLRRTDVEGPLDVLHRALHELVAFALFSATSVLPRPDELALSRDVQRRLRAIRA